MLTSIFHEMQRSLEMIGTITPSKMESIGRYVNPHIDSIAKTTLKISAFIGVMSILNELNEKVFLSYDKRSVLDNKIAGLMMCTILCAFPHAPKTFCTLALGIGVLVYHLAETKDSPPKAHPLAERIMFCSNLIAKTIISIAAGVFTEELIRASSAAHRPIISRLPEGSIGVPITLLLLAISARNIYRNWKDLTQPMT